MDNFYHKIAVASVGITLAFALGANKEAKAATITLTSATSFGVHDLFRDGVGNSYYSDTPFYVGLRTLYYAPGGPGEKIPVPTEDRAFYEFNIANLSLASDTVIRSAIFRVRVDSLRAIHRYYGMQLFGYAGNGQPDTSDFSNGRIGAPFGIDQYPLSDFSIYLGYFMTFGPAEGSNFDISFSVAPFINDLISKNNAFAGFSLRDNGYFMGEATLNNRGATLTIETVPEPTTIFGSALALGVGGWLKRKKSSQQSKTTSQH